VSTWREVRHCVYRVAALEEAERLHQKLDKLNFLGALDLTICTTGTVLACWNRGAVTVALMSKTARSSLASDGVLKNRRTPEDFRLAFGGAVVPSEGSHKYRFWT
jgi:hypothetical protein